MTFDKKNRRYVDDQGNVMSPAEVRKEVEDYVAKEEKRAEAEAEKFRLGLISQAAFFFFMKNRIETWHKVTGTIAYGGRTQMNEERLARIQAIIDREQSFLDKFKDEVSLSSELTEGIDNRAGMYADAAYSTFENQTRERERDSGVTTGRRVCEEDTASCEECVSASSTYFTSLDDIPEIGSLTCLNNCRCYIVYAEAPLEARIGIGGDLQQSEAVQ